MNLFIKLNLQTFFFLLRGLCKPEAFNVTHYSTCLLFTHNTFKIKFSVLEKLHLKVGHVTVQSHQNYGIVNKNYSEMTVADNQFLEVLQM